MPSTERRKTRNVATAVKEVFDGLVSVATSSARARWKHGEYLRPGHDAAGQRRSRHRQSGRAPARRPPTRRQSRPGERRGGAS